MTLKEALNKGISILKSSNTEAPAVEAGVMLCSAVDRNKVFLYAHGDFEMNEKEVQIFFEMLRRRALRVPLQYITGRQEFMSLEFLVSPDVLIPRQDTEILVEAVIQRAANMPLECLRILDIGTGSGCIAVSLAYYLKNCTVTAVDISEKALGMARLNAANAGVGDKVEFVRGNLFEAIEDRAFDIIVSNPPYIPKADIDGLQVEVKDYEPRSALDGGGDGLDFYRKIAEKSTGFLATDGILAFEVGLSQAGHVSKLMEIGFCDIKVFKDLAGIDRVVMGKLR